jgi:hypothetical protein
MASLLAQLPLCQSHCVSALSAGGQHHSSPNIPGGKIVTRRNLALFFSLEVSLHMYRKDLNLKQTARWIFTYIINIPSQDLDNLHTLEEIPMALS